MTQCKQNECDCARTPIEQAVRSASPIEQTVPAGEACDSNGCLDLGAAAAGTGEYAVARVRTQQYVSGFCPEEALRQGTLFPELVSEYPLGGGCANG